MLGDLRKTNGTIKANLRWLHSAVREPLARWRNKNTKSQQIHKHFALWYKKTHNMK